MRYLFGFVFIIGLLLFFPSLDKSNDEPIYIFPIHYTADTDYVHKYSIKHKDLSEIVDVFPYVHKYETYVEIVFYSENEQEYEQKAKEVINKLMDVSSNIKVVDRRTFKNITYKDNAY